MRERPVVIVGAGVGGLTAAVVLASRGIPVLVVERATQPGGKMRTLSPRGRPIDAGPTVFTLKPVFEEIFSLAGVSFDDRVKTRPAQVLARHFWGREGPMDLFADKDASYREIARFAGDREGAGYARFMAEAQSTYDLLYESFIRADRPTPLSLVTGAGFDGLTRLWRIRPFETLWQALGSFFADRRLRQLFGRYATYCGSSPFACPATLMLVAHVEQAGVWYVEGGMHHLAQALATLACEKGASIRYSKTVTEILTESGRTTGVKLNDGERVAATAVIFNGDQAALRGAVDSAMASRFPAAAPDRSLSALTICLEATVRGTAPLTHHTVFFSSDYKREFDEIFGERRLPSEPTVYVCAQDRIDDAPPPDGPERLMILVNAPPTGDTAPPSEGEINRCLERTLSMLATSGLGLELTTPPSAAVAGPAQFASMFPATGGALYGPASHGWRASFTRAGTRSPVPGLFLAGGSVHPGPGVPMAALSGLRAASNVMSDLASTSRWSRAAISGGTSTA